MKKIWRFLREAATHDAHLFLAFIAAAIFIVIEINGLLHGDEKLDAVKGILLLVMIAVLSLAGDAFRGAKERREIRDRLKKLVDSLADKPIVLRDSPSEREDYFYLWDNFTGIYRAYSPAYRVEESTSKKAVRDVYVRRYRNDTFEEARYLFLTHDECGQKDLQKFRELMTDVRTDVPDCGKKITVKELPDVDAEPSAELYIGTRDGKSVAILEPRHPVLGPRHGVPLYYAVIHDKTIVDSLRFFFNEQWERAKDVQLFTR